MLEIWEMTHMTKKLEPKSPSPKQLQVNINEIIHGFIFMSKQCIHHPDRPSRIQEWSHNHQSTAWSSSNRQCWRSSSQSTGGGEAVPLWHHPSCPPKPWCNASKQQKAQVLCWASQSLRSPAITSGEEEQGIITSPWQRGHTRRESKPLARPPPHLKLIWVFT